ncbi:MAG: 2-amino-4-hydroxy-6-hydroxymethyldihydropteridine diphosphokinase [Antricoccus sp.]
MSTAVLSIGSNVGDSVAHLQSVVDAGGERVRALSPIYRTAPWGGVQQDPFYNAIVIADDDGYRAADWLSFAAKCEQAAERTRTVRWGPRTLDVDVVAVYDGQQMLRQDNPELTLPHPRAHQRRFVLEPWLSVQPDAQLPMGSVRSLVQLVDDQQLTRLDDVHLHSAVSGG